MGGRAETDEALVRRIQQGKGAAEALDSLICFHLSKVSERVGYMVPEGEVEDVVQEIFLRTISSIGSFNFRSAFETWLYHIITNTVADYFRRNGRYKNYLASLADDNEQEGNSAFSALEASIDIERALERLSPEYREVISLKFFAGLSFVEIAKSLGITYEAARSRYRRAIWSLSTKFKVPRKNNGQRKEKTVMVGVRAEEDMLKVEDGGNEQEKKKEKEKGRTLAFLKGTSEYAQRQLGALEELSGAQTVDDVVRFAQTPEGAEKIIHALKSGGAKWSFDNFLQKMCGERLLGTSEEWFGRTSGGNGKREKEKKVVISLDPGTTKGVSIKETSPSQGASMPSPVLPDNDFGKMMESVRAAYESSIKISQRTATEEQALEIFSGLVAVYGEEEALVLLEQAAQLLRAARAPAPAA